MRLVTLTTDFGDSAFVGAMKGVILSRAPEARVVDVSHAVPPQGIVEGALALLAAAPFFPRGTVHVGVVDPGVGSARRAVLLRSGGHLFVGPDNGLLLPAARALGTPEARLLENARLFRRPVAPTFHGRDVFAAVAGALASGVDPAAVGGLVAVDDLVQLDFGEPRVDGDTLVARVLAVDPFGNLVSNVPAALAAKALGAPQAGAEARPRLVRAGKGKARAPFVRTFADVEAGAPLLYVGSGGFLEVAVRNGSAAQNLGAVAGDAVTVEV